jgi:glutathione synthase
LKALGLYFVGIDIIGGRLIEVNVTSPTCIQEINQANQVEIENQIYAFAKAEYERKTHEA